MFVIVQNSMDGNHNISSRQTLDWSRGTCDLIWILLPRWVIYAIASIGCVCYCIRGTCMCTWVWAYFCLVYSIKLVVEMERDAYQRNLLHFFFEKKRTFYIYMVCLHQKLPDLRWFVVIVQLFIKRGVSCSLLLCQMFRFSEVQAPCCPSNFAAWILFFSSTHMIFISWQDGEGGVWFGKRKKKNRRATFLSLQHFYVCVNIGDIFSVCVCLFFTASLNVNCCFVPFYQLGI